MCDDQDSIPCFTDRFTCLCQRLQDGGDHVELSKTFGKLKTNEERVEFVCRLQAARDFLQVSTKLSNKWGDESIRLRTQGNSLFKKGSYKMAMHFYTKSILYAPHNSKESALAFANRSAVLFHIEMYSFCLQDISASLSAEYPVELRYKLFDRRAKCCHRLGTIEDAKLAAKEARDFLEKANLDEVKKTKWIKDLNVLLARPPSNVQDLTENEPQYCWELPETKDGRNLNFPSTSPAFNLAYSPEKGRYAVATRDIDIGEVIVVEEPYAATLVKSFCKTHCQGCLCRVVAPLPCWNCSAVVYCSELCRQTAWDSYHYAECRFLDLIHGLDVGLGHLALRVVLTAGLSQVLQCRDSRVIAEDHTNLGFGSDGAYGSHDYTAAFNLVYHDDKRTISDLFRRAVMAALLLKILEKTSFFESSGIHVSDKDFFYVGGHILRHIMMLPCNAHEVSELTLVQGNLAESRTKEIGSALYNTLSLINHSCDPSVMRQSYGSRCVARASRFIPKGGEIVDNYGALCALSTKTERNTHLMSQYYFCCNCEACDKDWPQYFDIPNDVPVLKCQNCCGPVILPLNRLTEQSECVQCKSQQDITYAVVRLKHSSDIYKEALDKVLQGKDLLGSLPVLLGHLRLLDEMVYRPWRDYNDCQEAIKQIYNTMGNCFSE